MQFYEEAMFLKRMIVATGLCAAAISFTAPITSATEKCAPFRVVTDPDGRMVKLIDHAEPGASHGDVRIGYTAVHDENGSKVGYVRWSVQALGRDENLGNAILVFDNGQIHVQ